MKTKPSDILYCAVSEEKIKAAKPTLNEDVVKYHHLYMTERHEIYKRKDIEKLPQPWTEDEVFLNYRFTNVRRELDRESKWLIKNISENETLCLKEKILWSILFRTYNKSSTFEILQFPHALHIESIDDDNIDEIRNVIEAYTLKNPKYVWFTPAFNTGGLKYANAFPKRIAEKAYLNQPSLKATLIHPDGKKEEMTYKEARDICEKDASYTIDGWEQNIPLRMIWLIKNVADSNIVLDIINAKSQKEVFDLLASIHGIARFLAYQIFVDLTYIPEFRFSENEFTISGPGCSLGISMLFNDKDGMTDEEAIFWVRDNIQSVWKNMGLEYNPEKLFDHLPEHDRCINVMMLENSFCELSKLVKAKTNTGRPRNKYTPTENKKSLLSF